MPIVRIPEKHAILQYSNIVRRNSESMTFRAFISTDLNNNDEIDRFFSDLRPSGKGLKIVDPSTLHITLKFLGDTDEELIPNITEAMVHAAEGIKPFTIALEGAGYFGSGSKVRTLWIGIQEQGNLRKMAEVLDNELSKLGFPKEKRPFSPHLTIARAKDYCDSKRVKEIIAGYKDQDFGEQRVDFIRLKKSVLLPSGPSYSTVSEVALRQ